MAKTKIIFLDKDNYTELICFATTAKEVGLTITDTEGHQLEIILDISTAIKFSKTLRTNINIAKEYNGDNWLDEFIKEEGSNE